MAFPAVDDADCPFSDGSGNITLPAVSVGDRLIVGALSLTDSSGITPSDSLQHLLDTALTGSGFTICTYWKDIDGSEGGSVQLDGIGSTYCFLFVISGQDTGIAPDAAGATGNGAAADPPNVNLSGGAAKDALWLEVGASAASGITAVSTNYTAEAASFDDTLRLGSRQLNAASENPGTMAQSSSGIWGAQTIAIHPPGGGGGLSIPVAMHQRKQQGMS